jgi:hypothetical protein
LAVFKLAVLISGVLALAKLSFSNFITGRFDTGCFEVRSIRRPKKLAGKMVDGDGKQQLSTPIARCSKRGPKIKWPPLPTPAQIHETDRLYRKQHNDIRFL